MISRRAFGLLLTAAATAVTWPAAAQACCRYRNPRFGTTIDYPDSFRPGSTSANGDGRSFSRGDGAVFSIWGGHNALDHDLAGLEAFTREHFSKGEQVTYSARGGNWFVLSGTQGDAIFYERQLLSHGARIVNGFSMRYPGHVEDAARSGRDADGEIVPRRPRRGYRRQSLDPPPAHHRDAPGLSAASNSEAGR